MERAKAIRIVGMLRMIRIALYRYYYDTGDFPKAGSDWYDPGFGDMNGFEYLLQDDGSGMWRGPYISRVPEGSGPIKYRYWKSYITGDVRDGSSGWIHVENVKCAAVTL